MEPVESEMTGLKDTLVDGRESPLDTVAQHELHDLIEGELRQVSEPYRTTVVLRDIEELSYEEIAEIMETTLGTVKSRLTRGRDALKKRLQRHMPKLGLDFEVEAYRSRKKAVAGTGRPAGAVGHSQEIEVTS